MGENGLSFVACSLSAYLTRCNFPLPTDAAEEQIHEEVAPRCRGLQRAGGGGGFPGEPVHCLRPAAAGRHAGRSDRSPRAHPVRAQPLHGARDREIP